VPVIATIPGFQKSWNFAYVGKMSAKSFL
jgi:hypothetical protein